MATFYNEGGVRCLETYCGACLRCLRWGNSQYMLYFGNSASQVLLSSARRAQWRGPGSHDSLGSNAEFCKACGRRFSLNQEVATLPCGHTFHFDCLDTALKREPECPHCGSLGPEPRAASQSPVDWLTSTFLSNIGGAMSSTVEPESCEMVVQSSSQATALLSTQKLWWIKSATLGGGDEGKEKALDTKRSWTIGVRDKGSSVDEEYRIDLIWYRTHNVVRIFVDGSQAIEKPREFGHDGEVIPFSCAVACGTHQVWITSADIMGMIYQIEVLDATRKRDRNSAFGVSGWRKAALTERRTDMQRPTAARSYPRSAVVTRIDKASSSNSPRDLCQNAWSIVVTRDDMSTLKSEVHMTWNKYSDIMRITVDKVQTFHGTRSSQPEFEVMVGEFYGKIIRKSDDEFDMAMLEDPVKTFGPGQQVMISSDDASLEPLYALTSRPPMPQVMVIESARPVGKFNKPSKLRYVWRVQLSQTDGDRNNQRVVLTWTKSSSLIRIFVNAEEVWAGGLDSNGLLNAFVMLGECKAQIFSTATDSENFQLRIIPKVDSSKSMSTVQSESPTMRLESPIATRLQTADPKCMARSTLPLLALHADVSSPVPSACAPTESTADPNNPLLEGSNAPTSVAPTSPVDTLISAGRHSSTGSPAVVRGMEFARLGARGQPENDPFHQQQQPDDVFEHDSTEDKSDDAYQDSAAAAGAFTDRAPIKVRKSAESSSTPPPIEEVEEPSGLSAAELSMRISSAKKENFPDTGTSQSVSQPLSIPFEADPRIPLAAHRSAALMVRSESAKVGIGKYLKKTKLKYLWRIVTQDGDTTHRITLTWSKRSQKVRIWNGSQLVSEQLRKTETEFCTEFSIAGSTVKVLARKGTDEFILDAGPSNCVKRGMDDTTSFSASACASPTMSQASSYIAESTHTGKSGELQPGAKVTPTCETQIHREFSKIGVGQFQRNSKLKYGWRLQIEDEEEGMLECLLVLTWSRSSGRVRVMIEDRILIDRSWDPKLSRFAATIPFGDRAIIVNSTIDDDFHVDVVKKSDFPFLQMSKGIEEDEETVSNPFLSTFLPDDRFYHEE